MHSLRAQVEALEKRYGVEHGSPEADSIPLFPTRAGGVASKKSVIEAWQRIAPEGHETLSGHSARRSGAKALARAGWPVEVIMFLGRWASRAVMRYVEEALAEQIVEAVFADRMLIKAGQAADVSVVAALGH